MARPGDPAGGSGPDTTRAMLPFLALVVAGVAVVTDPGGWWEALLLVVPVVLVAGWARWGIPPWLLTAGVLGTVIPAQWDGYLEPSMFLVSCLALILTGWSEFTWVTGVLVTACLLSPPTLAVSQQQNDTSWGIWMVGIAFPAFMGWAFHRQEELTRRLEQARRELAEQAVLEERRRIARDVHDFVGHGLAAMMLQVTSARHVLRRDAQAADEALDAAEDVGRRSMQELRRTVGLLREGDSAVAAPAPSLDQVAALVTAARAGGIRVAHETFGDHSRVDAVVGLTLYRIAQESLANASRHAPHADTTLTTTVADGSVSLVADTVGPLERRDPERAGPRHYGLRGMRERAEVVGGVLEAGPTADGWRVRCDVPLPAPSDGHPAQAVPT